MKSINGKRAYTTTDISKLLGFSVGGNFIESELGVEPDLKNNNCKMWSESKLIYICHELMQYIFGVQWDLMYKDEDDGE